MTKSLISATSRQACIHDAARDGGRQDCQKKEPGVQIGSTSPISLIPKTTNRNDEDERMKKKQDSQVDPSFLQATQIQFPSLNHENNENSDEAQLPNKQPALQTERGFSHAVTKTASKATDMPAPFGKTRILIYDYLMTMLVACILTFTNCQTKENFNRCRTPPT